jgi:hypothetical protein
VAEWSLLTNHAWVLLCIAHDPGVRLRDIAARVGVTERTAYGIVTDLTEAGYVVKQKEGAATAIRTRPTCRFAGRCQCLTAGDSQPSAKSWHSSPASASASAQPGCLPGRGTGGPLADGSQPGTGHD